MEKDAITLHPHFKTKKANYKSGFATKTYMMYFCTSFVFDEQMQSDIEISHVLFYMLL